MGVTLGWSVVLAAALMWNDRVENDRDARDQRARDWRLCIYSLLMGLSLA